MFYIHPNPSIKMPVRFIYIYKSNGKTVSRDSVGAELFTDPPYISQRRGGVS